MLLLKVYPKGKYQVVSIKEDVRLDTDISELNSIIRWLLERKTLNFAIRFTPTSFLGTRAVSHFITCLEMIVEKGGRLAVINPNKYIRNFVSAIDFDHDIKMFANEEELTFETAVA